MISIEHALARAKATRDVQATLALAPCLWTWSKKPVAQWTTDLTAMDQLQSTEIAKRTGTRNAAEMWQSDLDQLQQITRDVAGFGKDEFREDPSKFKLFKKLRTDGRSRPTIYAQAKAAYHAWQESNPAWVYSDAVTLVTFGALVASAESRGTTHGSRHTAWRLAAGQFRNKARALDRDNIAWYAVATRKFPAGTVEGDLIRSTIPTTTRADQPVGQAVISNVMVAGTDIHFDCAAPHATRYTYLHKTPGATAFVVVASDSPESSLTLHGQAAGVHQFKALGRNSRGEGPESVVASATVAAQGVA